MRAMHGEVDMFYHGAEFELGRGKNYSINEIADIFYDGHNVTYIDPIPGEARNTLCRSELARKKLRWKPKTDFLTELTDTIKFYINKYESNRSI